VRFLNREEEMARLNRLYYAGSGLAVLWGRRRIGKTRLLVEWVRQHGGVYTVADRSSPAVQRRDFSTTIASAIPGFADVTYPDWRTLLARLARDARGAGWRGPLVLDELPWWIEASPELPSVLQRWVDLEANELVIALAGSVQHMMHGLVLDTNAPLFGRAHEMMELRPLRPGLLAEVVGPDPAAILEGWTAWGGVPRYWELAARVGGTTRSAVDDLVLDPLGPLHTEPERLIAEELPPAWEVRPLLDIIGGGANRVSEIAGRLERPATSLHRPLHRLIDMGLVRREVPFEEDERASKRSLYRIADPFARLWFRLVARQRAALVAASPSERRALLDRVWPQLQGEAWEDLCRQQASRLGWRGAGRWWQGAQPEWDVVARDGSGTLCLGECKLAADLPTAARALARRPAPPLSGADRARRVLFAANARGDDEIDGVRIIGADTLLADTLLA
jgi:AAA+ ATPase superfamily predicted ATPase